MTLKVDGTNGVLQAYDYQVLTTGFTYTFAAGTQTLVANPAGTLASGTVTMPASPADGMVITVVSTQQVTAVTVAANTGQTMVGGASQLIPNQPLSFVYRLSNTTWYPYAGGAGRATQVVSGTTVASTSGTSIDFTGIPSWAKRITVLFNGVSTSGTNDIVIQIGAGSFVTSGYTSGLTVANSTSLSVVSYSNGFATVSVGAIADAFCGVLVLSSFGSNVWMSQSSIRSTATRMTFAAGTVALGGTLDRVRITGTAGSDTFDAGSINILYE